MHKILLTAAATVLLVLFGMQNSDHVPVSFIFGGPSKVRLIFLLVLAAAFGFVVAYLIGLNRELKLKRQIRKLADLSRSAIGKLPADKIEGLPNE
jgi:uncharacterized integral membrane protein